jgi:tetratricopeptide (TPR) repeat protein
MAQPAARRYRAFVSYSHKDRAVGDKLFRRLDGYRVPKPLRGRETRFGPVPKKLYPCFRDREELATAADLPDRIDAALAASDTLVVVCTPNAAGSVWVEREIERFRELGKGDRIHPVIAEGEPEEAFPPALTGKGGTEPLAADLRESGDGWSDGPLKVAAGVLDLPFGELKDREVARARARARRNGAIALLFALLFVAAGVAAWRAVEETRRANAELTRAEAAILTAVEGVGDIVEQVADGSQSGAISTAVADGLLQTADAMVAGVIDLAPDNPRLLQAQGRLLIEFSRHYRTVGDIAAAQRAAERAERIYADLAAADPNALAPDWQLSVALVARGDSLLAAGDREGALAAYEESLEIQRRLAAADPSNASAARNVSVGLERVGDVLRAAGDREGALAAYEESLEIRRGLAAADPGNAGWARDVSVGLNKVGDVRLAAGDREGALAAYEESLEILRGLAAADPGNAGWARDVFVSLANVGLVHEAAGNLHAAREAYAEAYEINARLVRLDPGNAQWVRDRARLEQRLVAVGAE